MSARKRKSQWDSREETQLPAQISENNALQGKANHSNLHASLDSKWSNLEADYSLTAEDCSRRRPSWEQSQGNSGQKDDSRDLNDIRENRKALDGDKSYHVSPGFDDWGQQNNSRSPGNSWSQSHRYGRSRSQSRSRSRSRGRGRGRSRSRSRGRGRSRSRDWGRSRSRSRSRTPLGGYRQESYRWSDRRSGSGVSSQPCRDFTAGKCRRGSQCRFIHQDNLNDRDGGRLDRDQAESRRSRQERGGHFYDGEKDEPPRNSSKSSMLCNDFLKGRCLRGSSCRYSHHDASGDYSERTHKNSYFNHDFQRQPRKTGSTPCKFFLMGKCNRENCRFSHDGPVRGNLEGKSQDSRRGHDFDDMNKSWNGPKWSEAAAVSDIAESTEVENWRFSHDGPAQGNLEGKSRDDRRGHDFDDMNRSWNGSKWGEATAVSDIAQSTGWGNVGNGTSIDPITAEKQTDDRWVHKSAGWDNINVENVTLGDPMNNVKLADHRQDLNLDNESRMWSDSAADRDENVSPNLGSIGHVVNTGTSGSKDVEKSFDREEPRHTAQVLQSQTPYGISENVHQQNIMQEASGQQLASTVMHTLFPEKSQIQQHQTKLEDNSAITDDFNSGKGVDIYGNARHSAIVLGQNIDQNADSFVSQPPSFGGINQNRDMISGNLSNGHNIDLNGPVQQNYSPSNLQNQSQIQHGEFVKAMVNSSIPQNIVNSEQVKQITIFPESLTQIFGNGQLPQLYAALNPPNSTELVPSFPESASLLPPITSVEAQTGPTTMSQKLYDPTGSGIETNKHGDCNQLPGFLSNSIEQKNQMLLKHLSPSSAVGLDDGKLHKNVCPKDNIHRSPELTQQKPASDSVLGEDSKSIADKGKPEPENTSAGNVDADARAGDGTNGKDEKAMRLFKNALVEFVKEILKPKWKEGQMSREVHKTIVKKVVDKVTNTMQGPNIPNTQDKIDQYLSSNKPRLSKLVEAYTGRLLKSS